MIRLLKWWIREHCRIFHSFSEQCPYHTYTDRLYFYIWHVRGTWKITHWQRLRYQSYIFLTQIDGWKRILFSEPFLSSPRKIYRSTSGLTWNSYEHFFRAKNRKATTIHFYTSKQIRKISRNQSSACTFFINGSWFTPPLLRNQIREISPLRNIGLSQSQTKGER